MNEQHKKSYAGETSRQRACQAIFERPNRFASSGTIAGRIQQPATRPSGDEAPELIGIRSTKVLIAIVTLVRAGEFRQVGELQAELVHARGSVACLHHFLFVSARTRIASYLSGND